MDLNTMFMTSGIETASSFIASSAPQVHALRSVPRLENWEQPFTMPEEESTDSTGIVLSDEARVFLDQLPQSDKKEVVSSSQGSSSYSANAMIAAMTTASVMPSSIDNAYTREASSQAQQNILTEAKQELATKQEKNDKVSQENPQASKLSTMPLFNTAGLLGQSATFAHSQAINTKHSDSSEYSSSQNNISFQNQAQNVLSKLQTSVAVQALQGIDFSRLNTQSNNQHTNAFVPENQQSYQKHASNAYQKVQTQPFSRASF